MSKRQLSEPSASSLATKKCISNFKTEWLNEFVHAALPDSSSERTVKLGDIFKYREIDDDVVCEMCFKANAGGDFSTGKRWEAWKLDYLKRHIKQKIHTDAVLRLRSIQSGGVLRMLTESVADRGMRQEAAQRKSAKEDQVKILIDNVLLAINMNTSMNAVQYIHNHMAKYASAPDSWRSKNYAFEFVHSIDSVVKDAIISELRNAKFHTLTVDESTDISLTKMLILYAKFWPHPRNVYKTVFVGILSLSACDSKSVESAITEFYQENSLDMQKMVMFTSDGASVMLGKNNGVAAILRRRIPHLLEQHCVAHREDLGIDDACKHISLMADIETFLRTVYTLFSRSTVWKAQFTELAKVLECDSVAFRPLNEIRWLSRHFALQALLRNIQVLTEYCEEQVGLYNDPVHKYCLKKLRDPQFRTALIVFDEVVGELAELCKLLQRKHLMTIEVYQFVKARNAKLRAQYLGENVHWSEEVAELLANDEDINMSSILKFLECLCLHLDSRFPESELMQWRIFEISALIDTSDFNFGQEELAALVSRYVAFLENYDDILPKVKDQYRNLRFVLAEKMKCGLMQTFDEMVRFVINEEQFGDIAILLDICTTFLASSADCERGFSLMNNIKIKSRNRLEELNLDMLMRIKSYQNDGHQINLDDVYKRWISLKDRCQSTSRNESND